MMMTVNVRTILLFSVLCITLLSCQNAAEGWQGTIEETDGVTVVKNPRQPLYGEGVFQIEEELAIGAAEGPEEYMFQSIRDMTVDEKGRIYVSDRKAGHIKVYDKRGEYIQTVGEKGQGPGEFMLPNRAFIKNGKELWIYDDGRRAFLIFTLEGDFIEILDIYQTEGLEARIDSQGNISVTTMEYAEDTGDLGYVLKLFDSKLNLINTIASIPGARDQRGYNIFFPIFNWTVNSRDQIIYGYQKECELKVFNPQGELIKIIMKDHTPKKVTQAEIDKRMESVRPGRKVYIPEHHPVFRQITVDEADRIFIMLWPAPEDRNGYFFDVFDAEGKYTAQIFLPGSPGAWKDGKLYLKESDQDGYLYVKRYAVTWDY
jgi:hypothetical protein